MEFFRIKRDIPFMRYALIFNVISLITFLVAVGSLATKGLHFGVDFTGGTVMEVSYQQPPDLNRIRDRMVKIGFAEPSVQNFGTARDVLIRLPVKEGVTSAKLSEQVMQELQAARRRRSNCAGSSSSGPRSARNCSRTARWRCCSFPSASCSICGSVSSGSSALRRSSPTCTTW